MLCKNCHQKPAKTAGLCRACYSWQKRHNGQKRPYKDMRPTKVHDVCSNCHKQCRIKNIKRWLCDPCYKYFMHTGAMRPPEVYNAVANEYKRGNNNPMWKGQNTSRQTKRQRLVRLYPLDRCDKCGGKAVRRRVIDGNYDNLDRSNVQMLCAVCYTAATNPGIPDDGLCSNCHVEPQQVKGMCKRCYGYWKQTGQPRPSYLFYNPPQVQPILNPEEEVLPQQAVQDRREEAKQLLAEKLETDKQAAIVSSQRVKAAREYLETRRKIADAALDRVGTGAVDVMQFKAAEGHVEGAAAILAILGLLPEV